MRKLMIGFVFMFLFSAYTMAQLKIYPDGIYVIRFADKNGTPYSVDNPQNFLSKRAIDRRAKFGIEITEQDLPVSPAYIDSLEKIGLQVIETTKWLNAAIVKTNDTTLLNKALKFPFVLKCIDRRDFAIPKDSVIRVVDDSVKNDYPIFFFSDDDPMEEDKADNNADNELHYGMGKNQVEMLNVDYLHDKGFRGQGVLVALMDAGFYRVDKIDAFDSMFVNKRILGWKDFVAHDGSVFEDATHGLMALSDIAAYQQGYFVGTAPEASFWLLRTEDEKSENIIEEFNWLCAAEFADSAGVDVIHTSLGYNNFDDTTMSYEYKDMNGNTAISTIAADCAASKGIVVISSAGNEGDAAWRYITAPADGDSVLAVGAVRWNGELVYFSSRGPSADGRVKPDACARGFNATVIGADGKRTFSSGTSFAGPIFAGAVICLRQAFPMATVGDIINAIHRSGSKYENPDADYGYGIPDFKKAYQILLNKYPKNNE